MDSLFDGLREYLEPREKTWEWQELIWVTEIWVNSVQICSVTTGRREGVIY